MCADVRELYNRMKQLEQERDKLIAERNEAPHDSEVWNYGYEEIAFMQADIDGYREDIEGFYLRQQPESALLKDNTVYNLYYIEILGYYVVTENGRSIGLFECASADAETKFKEMAGV